MGWILQCLLFVTMTISSAYNFRESPRHLYHLHDYGLPGPIYTNERIHQRSAERPLPRMNERSISIAGGVQRVQDNERVRVPVEPIARSGNVTMKIVNNHKYPTISSRRGADENPGIVHFPGRTSAQAFVPEIPKECQALGICEHIPNYPQDVIDNIIAKLGDKLDRFHVDELDPEITQRISPDDNPEIPLCKYRELLIKPQAAKGKNGNWFVILNRKENALQGFRVEVCYNQHQSCAENLFSFALGYTAKCKQKYVYRTMAAVDVDSAEVLYDMPFRVPSCCSCVAMHTSR